MPITLARDEAKIMSEPIGRQTEGRVIFACLKKCVKKNACCVIYKLLLYIRIVYYIKRVHFAVQFYDSQLIACLPVGRGFKAPAKVRGFW